MVKSEGVKWSRDVENFRCLFDGLLWPVLIHHQQMRSISKFLTSSYQTISWSVHSTSTAEGPSTIVKVLSPRLLLCNCLLIRLLASILATLQLVLHTANLHFQNRKCLIFHACLKDSSAFLFHVESNPNSKGVLLADLCLSPQPASLSPFLSLKYTVSCLKALHAYFFSLQSSLPHLPLVESYALPQETITHWPTEY